MAVTSIRTRLGPVGCFVAHRAGLALQRRQVQVLVAGAIEGPRLYVVAHVYPGDRREQLGPVMEVPGVHGRPRGQALQERPEDNPHKESRTHFLDFRWPRIEDCT